MGKQSKTNIRNKFLDLKTTKNLIHCFNGNEKINKNNFNLNSLKIESDDIKTKSLINEMLKGQNQLNNFYFGKKLYGPKYSKIKNEAIIYNYLKYKMEENINNNIVLTLDDRIKNFVNKTKEIKNNFIERLYIKK